MATPLHKKPCLWSLENYNFGRHFLGHHYHIFNLFEPCPGGEKKIFKRKKCIFSKWPIRPRLSTRTSAQRVKQFTHQTLASAFASHVGIWKNLNGNRICIKIHKHKLCSVVILHKVDFMKKKFEKVRTSVKYRYKFKSTVSTVFAFFVGVIVHFFQRLSLTVRTTQLKIGWNITYCKLNMLHLFQER